MRRYMKPIVRHCLPALPARCRSRWHERPSPLPNRSQRNCSAPNRYRRQRLPARMAPISATAWKAASPSRSTGRTGRPCACRATGAGDIPRWVRIVERLSREAAQDGWPGLLVGDLSQPRGGPMLSGHASPPDRPRRRHLVHADAGPPSERGRTRERVGAVPAGRRSLHVDDRRWTRAHEAVLRRAASYPEVERHPGPPRHQEKALRTR